MSKKVKISTNDFNLFYGDKHALVNIDLDILEKSATALIGPSGCGKSSFLRSLNRMNDTIPGCKATGTVMIDGSDIYDKNTDVLQLRLNVGMVFQKPNPFPKTIFANVAYGAKLHSTYSTKDELNFIVEDSLRKAGLWEEVKDRLHTPALQLSGGQQQRLCIARAIAIKPEVILMDEPCSALDPIATAKIEELIDELKSSYTIVVVTHSMQQAARISDRTAFFYMGKLIEVDSTSKIFTNPSNRQTEEYITGRFG